MVRVLVAAGVLATSSITAATAGAAGDPVEPALPAAATLRAELGRRSERLAVRPDSSLLAFVGGETDRPLQAAGAGGPAAAARRFVDRYAPAFGEANPADLVSPDVERTPAGDGVRFQQQHRGVPVLGGQMSVQLGRTGAVLSATGRLSTLTKLDVTPLVTGEAAASTAVLRTAKADQVDATLLSATAPELAVFDPVLWNVPHTRGARLVWSTAARTADGAINRLVLVDARDGSIALDFSQVHAARDRRVCDQQSAVLANPPACTNPVRVENGPASLVTDVNQAYEFAGLTYDFYFNVLGRDSIDGAGLPLRSTVRVCVTGAGGCPYQNAYWDGFLQGMFYGEGFAAADDVVGHELTHGVTQFTSNLYYYAQSGAINESLSDVFGELIDQSTPDAPGDRWLQGEDLSIGAIRNMADPTVAPFNDPDRMRSPNYWLQLGDDAGVHFNSGVNNKAAFLMTDGGTFNGQTITGLGATKTAHVYYLAQTTMLTSLSQYSDLANMLRQSCRNLIGQHGIVEADCQQVDKIVLATEMDLAPNLASLTPPAECITGAKNGVIAQNMVDDTAGWQLTSTAGPVPTFEPGPGIGETSLFVPDHDAVATSVATRTTAFTVPGGETIMSLRHLVGLERDTFNFYDGAVVEYSTNGTVWNDLQAAVTTGNVVNGYTNPIAGGSQNPLSGRSAFTGGFFGFTTTRYNLSPLAGQAIRLRFRVGSDSSFSTLGWMIDDISVHTCGSPQAPGAPGPVTASATSGQATVSWTAPFNGGSALTGYTVTPVANGVPQAPQALGANVTSTTFTGLTNGVSYRFDVTASNGIGASAVASSNTVVPGNAPAAPGAPTATRTGARVTLAWAAPASDAPITGYSIVPIRNGVAQPPVAVGAVTTHTLSGLTGGASYTFTVAAVSALGSGPPSAPSAAVTTIAAFMPLTPARMLETRTGLTTADGAFNGIGLLGAGSITPVLVAGRAGVPGDAAAVALNVTVTDTRGPGFLTVFPCGVDVPNASNLNFTAGMTVPNMVVSKVGAGGQVCIYTPTATHLLIDVNGFFPAGAALTPIVPARLLETRTGLPTFDGELAAIGRRGAATVTEVRVAGRAGVPADASAVVLNVTVTDTGAPGFATVYPCGGDVPTASNLNHGVGVTVPNATVTKVGANGSVCIFTWAPTHLLVDVTGWYPANADVTPLLPARLLESRAGLATTDGQFNGIGVRQPGVVTALQVTGRAGVPADATAVALNVTVTETQAPGFVTVFPCDGTPPTASNLNFGVGVTIANAVLAKVGPGGQVCFYSEAAHHLVVDVNGSVTS